MGPDPSAPPAGVPPVTRSVTTASRTAIVGRGAWQWVATAGAAGAVGGSTAVPVLGTVVGAVAATAVGLPAAALATVALAVAARPGTSGKRFALAVHVITGALVLASVALAVPALTLLVGDRDADVVADTHVGPVTVATAVVLLLLADRRLVALRPPAVPGQDRGWVATTALVAVVGLVVVVVGAERSAFGPAARHRQAADDAVAAASAALGVELDRPLTNRGGLRRGSCPGGGAIVAGATGTGAPLGPLADELTGDGWTVESGRTVGEPVAWLSAGRGEVRLDVTADRSSLTVQGRSGCGRTPVGPPDLDLRSAHAPADQVAAVHPMRDAPPVDGCPAGGAGDVTVVTVADAVDPDTDAVLAADWSASSGTGGDVEVTCAVVLAAEAGGARTIVLGTPFAPEVAADPSGHRTNQVWARGGLVLADGEVDAGYRDRSTVPAALLGSGPDLVLVRPVGDEGGSVEGCPPPTGQALVAVWDLPLGEATGVDLTGGDGYRVEVSGFGETPVAPVAVVDTDAGDAVQVLCLAEEAPVVSVSVGGGAVRGRDGVANTVAGRAVG